MQRKLTAPGGGKTLRAVRPNAGIEAAYRKKLVSLIDRMHRSVMWWVRAAYRRNTPAIAMDDTSADELQRIIAELRERWTENIDGTAEKLAEYFSQAVADRSDAALKKILRDGGFSVRFQMTPAMQDVFAATVAENVSLIKSIPARYFDQIEGIVMRGVQTGYDLKQITDDLQKQFGVTRKRAAFIARDQGSKANSLLSRARHLELGIETAIWKHSHAGKHPRPSHVKAGEDKVEYKISEGWLDPAIGKYIWPGTEINCRCTAAPVIPGFS
jgi:uncharacterized protein with gpF-like domain